MKKLYKLRSLFMVIVIIQSFCLTACGGSLGTENLSQSGSGDVRVGIAWRADTDSEFYTNIVTAIKEAGGEPVLLGQVIDYDLEYENGAVSSKGVAADEYLDSDYSETVKKNTYQNSNVADVIKDVDAVIFTGGEDISPMLLKDPEDWIGIEEEKDFNATRDVSDYLLMSYCIDNDIPTLGFCRGMQMMAVVSGASLIQDIPVYMKEQGIPYNFEHRNVKETPKSYRDYAPHDISIIDKKSHLYDMFAGTTVKSVPSWHHQAVKSVEGTKLIVTSVSDTNGYDIIESIERTDKSLIIGCQFHPEAAVVKNIDKAENAKLFMDKATALRIFVYFIDTIEEMGLANAA